MQTETIAYNCQRCGSANVVMNGFSFDGEQQYYCKDCKTGCEAQPREVGAEHYTNPLF